MEFIEVIVVLLVVVGIIIFIKWFRKLPIGERETNKRRRRNERKDYKTYWDEKMKAEENAEQRRFLQTPQPFNLIGDNSHAKRFGDTIR